MSTHLRNFLLALLLTAAGPRDGFSASGDSGSTSGTYPGRVLTELALHRQYSNQRLRAGYLPQAIPGAEPADIGNIAVLPDDGTLVIPANSFDLDQKSLLFRPAGNAYAVAAGPAALDAGAAGTLLNPPPAGSPENIGDDGTREVAIGFPFVFFGQIYATVFINSDGNLTFGQGDTATSQRSLGRFLSGAPRIAPYFADLDPSVAGQLTYLATGARFAVAWNQIPDYASSGQGPRETFQVVLFPDGRMQFAYSGINGREAVIGISPGHFSEVPSPLDFSGTDGSASFDGPLAEVFNLSTQFDVVTAAQRFYGTHEDAYDFLVLFTNFDFDLGTAFAYEVNVSNQVTGIGRIAEPPVFDYSREFGSSRLASLVNMGNLVRYPADPSRVFLRGADSPLTVLGQEAGHRFLAYITFDDPNGSRNSTALLGRDLQHWSFLLNSDASVLEGNRIRDNGNGTFTTAGVVEHYSELDQYLMGLRGPEEVSPSFFVRNPSPPISPARGPALNVTFSGQRADVAIDPIVRANGPRVPNAVISPKAFNFAFVLVIPKGSSPRPEQVAQVDALRRAWEAFYPGATSLRGSASTALIRGLRLTPNPVGLFPGTEIQGTLELLTPAGSETAVSLANSNPSAVALPSRVVIPAGARSASFPVAGMSPGRALVSASAAGFETSASVMEVVPGPSAAGLSLTATAGDQQVGRPGSILSRPLQVTLQDPNRIPFAGASVNFAVVEGNATLSPAGTATDGQGTASTQVALGEQSGRTTVRASVPGTVLTAQFSVFSVGTAQVAQGAVVNGAAFARSPAALSPGSIISIFGTNLSASALRAATLPLPRQLAKVAVEIGGVAAPLYFVSPEQINAQIPFELQGSAASLVVRNGVSSSAPVLVPLQTVAPGIFAQNSSGNGPGAITHGGSQLPVSAALPAAAGEYVQIFATGLGGVVPAVSTGQPAAVLPLSQTNSPPTVTIGGVAAAVNFAGLAPGFAGLYQVNAQVPSGIHGTADVVLTVNGVPSNTVTLDVR